MKELIKMVVVLTLLSSVSGGLLAYVEGSTKSQIEEQQLKFDKKPALEKIFEGASNDPIQQRFKIPFGEDEITIFPAEYDGKISCVAIEGIGKGGFGGNIGVMVGIDLETDKIFGMGVTSSKETPGFGSKAKDEPSFAEQFKGLEAVGECKVKGDGGSVDAIGGATITSKAVCVGVTDAGKKYEQLKSQIIEKI